jgi:hypothetical protein
MTFKYKLYQCINGHGDTFFRAKYHLVGPIYIWIRHNSFCDSPIVQWANRDQAVKALKKITDDFVYADSCEKRAKLANKIKIVLIEKVEV